MAGEKIPFYLQAFKSPEMIFPHKAIWEFLYEETVHKDGQPRSLEAICTALKGKGAFGGYSKESVKDVLSQYKAQKIIAGRRYELKQTRNGKFYLVDLGLVEDTSLKEG